MKTNMKTPDHTTPEAVGAAFGRAVNAAENARKPAEQSAHTALPWTVNQFGYIHGGDGRTLLAEVVSEDHPAVVKLLIPHAPVSEQEANAELICRAVNAHADLVAALKNTLGELERQAKTHRETGWAMSAGCCEESARIARAALAKAGAA